MALIVLDSCVILTSVLEEKGKRIESIKYLFEKIKNKEIFALIPTTLLAEIYAILGKYNKLSEAKEIENYLYSLGVKLVSVDRNIAVLAGILKNKYYSKRRGFSYNDTIVLATAIQTKGRVITYDKEFNKVTEVPVSNPADIV